MSEIRFVTPATVTHDRDEDRDGSAPEAALEFLERTVSNLLTEDLGELGRAVKAARAS